MRLGTVPTASGEGTILAHALKLPNGHRIAKGTLLSRSDLETIAACGIGEIVVARLDEGDIAEDAAAMAIAQALLAPGLRLAPAATGRVNLHTTASGLFVADRAKVDAINRADPGITLATLDRFKEVEAGRMVATVKIIPYALPQIAVEHAAAIAAGAIGIEPYTAKRIGVVATMLPALKTSVMDKTIRVLEERLRPSSSTIIGEIRTGHDRQQVCEAIIQLLPQCDLVLVFGASAICDINDVIPSAVLLAGGRVEHFGMPVDPGNLMLLGEVDGKAVIGAPGCARSPAENGFDWVLQRLLAGRKVTADEITGMGVGGLLMEIGGRPQPREPHSNELRSGEPKPHSGNVTAVVLAAGRSTRMGTTNKMLARLEGKPLLTHVLEAARGSRAGDVLAVTGHDREKTAALIAAAGAQEVHNRAFADGMSTSLRVGVGAVPETSEGVLVLLGDMPRINSQMIDRMIEMFVAAPPGSIIMASHGGVRGNPVLWPKQHFHALMRIEGDKGARDLIAEHARDVIAVELGEAAGFDLDTPEALLAAGGELLP